MKWILMDVKASYQKLLYLFCCKAFRIIDKIWRARLLLDHPVLWSSFKEDDFLDYFICGKNIIHKQIHVDFGISVVIVDNPIGQQLREFPYQHKPIRLFLFGCCIHYLQ